ncbi:MAG TPA: NAD-dependent epimerase/dehydratase family protein [Candidatus Acidoferrales bacterium]|nr:NAD-dependent epimerase/dehydratase family protein [Candidatus Acidoferrales bacterium]
MNKLSNKRILITGGAGMLGSTLALLAVSQGAKVRIVDAMLPLYGGNQFNLRPIAHEIDFIKGDIRDADAMKEAVGNIDYVFDLAAQVSYVHSNRDPLLDLDINCRGHLIVLEACRKFSPKAKLVFSSSRFVYGTTQYNPVDEGHPTNCTSIYGIHKLNVEKYLAFYHAAFNLETACVRIANPYGPRQQMKHNAYGIVNWFIRLAMDKKPLTIYGEGRQIRDYVFAEDVAKGLLAVALSRETTGKIYNLGSGTGTPFRDMVKKIADCLPNTEIREIPWPADRYFVESGDYVSDLSRIQAATGWIPEVDFGDGIEKTVSFYRENKQQYWETETSVAQP